MKTPAYRLLFSTFLSFAFGLGIVLTGPHAFAATHTLALVVQGQGQLSPNPDLPAYPNGSTITVTALPDPGWKWVGWSGDVAGDSNPLAVTMNADKAITGIFEPVTTHRVSFSVSGQGTVDQQDGVFVEGTELRVKATAANGWVFAGWGKDASGFGNPLTLLVDADRNVEARFAEKPYFVVEPEGSAVFEGESVTLQAKAAGTGPFTYQWFFQGNPISGATNSNLQLVAVQTSQDGIYQCSVISPYGSVRSREVRLQIGGGCSGAGVVAVCDEASLREAVKQSAYIRFCCNGTITLRSELVMTNDIVLDATGRDVVLRGAGTNRLLHILGQAHVAITNVVFERGLAVGEPGVDSEIVPGGGEPPVPGGDGRGGAVLNEGGDLVLDHCTFNANGALGGKGPLDWADGARAENRPGRGLGGAIHVVGGKVWGVNCSFKLNTVRGGQPSTNRGGVPIFAAESAGGAVYVDGGGDVKFLSTRFEENQATSPSLGGGAPRGGALAVVSGELELEDTVLSKNQSLADPILGVSPGTESPIASMGGALYVNAGGEVRVNRTVFEFNLSQGSQAFRHSGSGAGLGGAVYSLGTLKIQDSELRDNRAWAGGFSSVNQNGYGGALYTTGLCTVNGSTIWRNNARGGDAGQFGLINPNWPAGLGIGGGVYNSGDLFVTNSTLCLNTALGGERAGTVTPSGSGLGGGLFSTNGTVRLMWSTVASNEAVSLDTQFFTPNPGPVLGGNLYIGSGDVGLRNTLVAYGGTASNCFGVVKDLGYNMSSDASCGFNGGTSFNLTDPLLRPLMDNGGTTPTMALSAESPAIDFGALEGGPATDQTGRVRPIGAAGDIGAVEFDPLKAPFRVEWTEFLGQRAFRFTATSGSAYEIWKSTNLQNWERLEEIAAQVGEREVIRIIDIPTGSAAFFRVIRIP